MRKPYSEYTIKELEVVADRKMDKIRKCLNLKCPDRNTGKYPYITKWNIQLKVCPTCGENLSKMFTI